MNQRNQTGRLPFVGRRLRGTSGRAVGTRPLTQPRPQEQDPRLLAQMRVGYAGVERPLTGVPRIEEVGTQRANCSREHRAHREAGALCTVGLMPIASGGTKFIFTRGGRRPSHFPDTLQLLMPRTNTADYEAVNTIERYSILGIEGCGMAKDALLACDVEVESQHLQYLYKGNCSERGVNASSDAGQARRPGMASKPRPPPNQHLQ